MGLLTDALKNQSSVMKRIQALTATGDTQTLFEMWEKAQKDDPGLAAILKIHHEAALINKLENVPR